MWPIPLLFLLAYASGVVAHLEYLRDDATYDRFVQRHGAGEYRLVLFREDHAPSLAALKRVVGSGGEHKHTPTAAVLASNVTAWKDSHVPRVVIAGVRWARRSLGGSAGGTVYEYGAHPPLRYRDHTLMLVGLHDPAGAVSMFADMASEHPGEVFVYARIPTGSAPLPPRTKWLMGAWGFVASKPNEVHVVRNNKAVRSFKFINAGEFAAGSSAE